MFTPDQITNNMKGSMENLFNTFHINQLLMIDSDMLNNCYSNSDDPKCESSTSNLSYAINSYLQTLNETTYNYYIVVEYSEYNVDGDLKKCVLGTDEGCTLYHVSLGI